MTDQEAYDAGEAHAHLIKVGGDASTAFSMSGELYLSKSGWLLLDVPNALVRGAFQAMHEPGAELPPQHNGILNAHCTVMRPEELERIGGADKVTERGKRFAYTLGPLKEVVPDGWADMAKCWFAEINSPELKTLRKSYGLSPLPKNNKHEFHITVAVKRKHVLKANDVSKAASSPAGLAVPAPLRCLLAAKTAGLFMPIVRTGGLALDIAGLQAIGGHAEPEKDPALDIMDDPETLAAMRGKKRKVVKPPPGPLDPVAQVAAYYHRPTVHRPTPG